jgi:RNA 2',3'-cyclic 3'-phosphodiesterase
VTRLARGFVAVVPPDAVLDALDDRVATLTREAPSLRWLPRQHWHITLAFLGRVDDADGLSAALTAAVRNGSPFTLRLGTGGAFPAPRRASVLWVGVARGAPDVIGLATTVQAAATGLADHAEDRPYHPHLTVARAPRARSLTGLVDAIGTGPIGPPWPVTDVSVIESDTRPTGAVHTVQARIPLRDA